MMHIQSLTATFRLGQHDKLTQLHYFRLTGTPANCSYQHNRDSNLSDVLRIFGKAEPACNSRLCAKCKADDPDAYTLQLMQDVDKVLMIRPAKADAA